jgi:hypothetical protein
LHTTEKAGGITALPPGHSANLQIVPGAASADEGELVRVLPGGKSEVIWSGETAGEDLDSILSSPAREQIVDQLSQGCVAVWLFLDTAEGSNDSARKLLSDTLRKMEHQLQWHDAYKELLKRNGHLGAPPEIRFSIVDVQREDPEETVLIQQLLTSEYDLASINAPMAFPVYGRGRILYALVGAGISERNIARACAFLAGPCACTIKDDNPGTDLLLDFAWDEHITDILKTAEEFVAPGGFENLGETLAWGAPARPQQTESAPKPQTQVENELPEPVRHSPVIQRSIAKTIGLTAILILTLSIWLFLKKRS